MSPQSQHVAQEATRAPEAAVSEQGTSPGLPFRPGTGSNLGVRHRRCRRSYALPPAKVTSAREISRAASRLRFGRLQAVDE